MDTAKETDEDVLASGIQAIADERPNDATSAFEILADRGRVDPVASYDRGLAYALRVRTGNESPGDLGKAAHGFEEAIALTDDPALRRDAQRALEQVRTEVGRRRAREGTAVELDVRRPLWRALGQALPEDAWAGLAIAASMLFAVALFFRWRSVGRLRAASNVAAFTLVPIALLAAAATEIARHDRRYLREAVVIAENARLSDARGVTLAGSSPLPEGARVEIVNPEAIGTLTEVKAAGVQAFLPTSSLRPIAVPED